jgi:RND superfamily putative drug exporter
MSERHARAGRFSRIIPAVVAHPWRVLLGWLVLLAVFGGFAGGAQDALQGAGFDVGGSQSQQVSELLDAQFHDSTLTDAVVVYRSSGDVTAPDFANRMIAADAKLRTVAGVAEVRDVFSTDNPTLVSQDRHTAITTVSLEGGQNAAQNAIPALRDALHGSGMDAKVTGFPAVQYDTYQLSKTDLAKTEMITFPLVAILLLLFFRTAVAALLPLLLGGASVVTATGIIGLLGRQLPISVFALNIGSVVGLGIGIDFSLIIVRRFREERAAGRLVPEAVERTMRTAGRSVLISGLTLVLAMIAVTAVYADMMIVRSIILGVALVAGIGLLAAMLLLPALLSLLGHQLERFRILPARIPAADSEAAHEAGVWYRLSRWVTRRPVLAALGSLLVLAVLTSPLLHISLIGSNTAALPAATESRQGADEISGAFAANSLNPIKITVTAPERNGVFTPAFLTALRRFSSVIAADPRTDQVGSLSTMLPTVADDKFALINRSYFTEGPEVTPGQPVTSPGVAITPLIYATAPAAVADKITVPAWVGLGQFTLPGRYHQRATSVHAVTTLRVGSGQLTVRSSSQAQVIRVAQPSVPVAAPQGQDVTLTAGDQMVVPADTPTSFRTGQAPVKLLALTSYVIRTSAITAQNGWTEGTASNDLFAGAPRKVLTGAVAIQMPTGARVYEVDKVTVQPGGIIPRHVHPGPEIMTGVSGALTIYAATPEEMTASYADGRAREKGFDTPLVIRAGDHALVQEEKVHRAANLGSTPAVVYSARVWQADRPGTSLAAPTQLAAGFVNLNGAADTATITVIPKAGMYDRAHQQFVEDLRSGIVREIPGLAPYQVMVGGDAASFIDFRGALFGRFPLVLLMISLSLLLLLLIFFRSVLLPVKAVITSLLPLVASYGVLVWIFQDGHLENVLGFDSLGRLNVVTPLIVFVILFALSTDYEIFLLSRVQENYRATGDTEQAVALGLQQTAGTITTAALILVATFGSLAASSVETLKEMGIGLAVGVLLDATLVRLLLVPASMQLFRAGNWWIPQWLDRVLPRISHDGSEPPVVPPPRPSVDLDTRQVSLSSRSGS